MSAARNLYGRMGLPDSALHPSSPRRQRTNKNREIKKEEETKCQGFAVSSFHVVVAWQLESASLAFLTILRRFTSFIKKDVTIIFNNTRECF